VSLEPVGRDTLAMEELASRILSLEISDAQSLSKAKREVATKYSLGRYPSNAEILSRLPDNQRERFQSLLRVHPRRSGSGIVVVTVFSAPFSCPHGTCTFCPGGIRAGTPQSYLPDSPGMRTALALQFDSFDQARESLRKYRENGHVIGKVETILEGGTFLAVPEDYQRDFVKGAFEGLTGRRSVSLEEAQIANETAASRCVGLTLETKPDWCGGREVDKMLQYGVTRVEIGVQSLSDEALRLSNRGHTAEDSVRAFQVARDAGLKITAHMMPGLPGMTPEADLRDLRRLFEAEEFRPDMMKLYPTLVVEGTALEKQFLAGKYEPYGVDVVVELLSEMKRFVPPWHRIMRIQREIPAHEIVSGVKNGNLRELVLSRAKEKGFSCRCIRCREVALGDPTALSEDDELEFRPTRYSASGGDEVFHAAEYRKSHRIAGFVRMRRPSASAHRVETRGSCIVRELKVYGRAVDLGERDDDAWQHRGIGTSLMGEMERVAREDFDAKRLLVTSAVGTRNYYRRLGYERLGPYMAKKLS
jgi:elongator complex protein 3